ncbi:MAG: radical SAM protein [Candidatus Atribacteria bacterium]|nr:radical SAM protein [Candidatus Atribacteria bacterium]
MKEKCIFGPVQSRRLGKSLGINLTPYKTCSLDCAYCECGKTTDLTIIRKDYIPIEYIQKTMKKYSESSLFRSKPPSCVTFAGFGEPTLHSGFGSIAKFAKKTFPEQHLVLITNGTLFPTHPELFQEIQPIDIILPSLDAGSEKIFKRIDRPHPSITLASLVEGLIHLRKNYHGQIWLEIFIVEGINDSESELYLMRDAISRISPDRVQLNSLDRNPAENWVNTTSPQRLIAIAEFLGAELLSKNAIHIQVEALV